MGRRWRRAVRAIRNLFAVKVENSRTSLQALSDALPEGPETEFAVFRFRAPCKGGLKAIIDGFGCMPPSLDYLRLPSVEISEGGPKRNLGTEALSREEPEVRIHLPPAKSHERTIRLPGAALHSVPTECRHLAVNTPFDRACSRGTRICWGCDSPKPGDCDAVTRPIYHLDRYGPAGRQPRGAHHHSGAQGVRPGAEYGTGPRRSDRRRPAVPPAGPSPWPRSDLDLVARCRGRLRRIAHHPRGDRVR